MDGMITLKFTANFFNLKRIITFFGEIEPVFLVL